MVTLFISDLHLKGLNTPQGEAFEAFLNKWAEKCDALYILGDFFDAWFGDDATSLAHQAILAQLKTLSAKFPIFVMHGNRDFLLGEQFEKMSGCSLIPDPSVVTCYQQSLLLTHGDSLCVADKSYQRYRKIVRNPWIKRCFLQLPKKMRLTIANGIRQRSKAKQNHHLVDGDEIPEATLKTFMKTHQASTIIHGHIHFPMIHLLAEDKHLLTRYVLSDWTPTAHGLILDRKGHFSLGAL